MRNTRYLNIHASCGSRAHTQAKENWCINQATCMLAVHLAKLHKIIIKKPVGKFCYLVFPTFVLRRNIPA